MAEAKVTITADDRASAALQQISAETKNVGNSTEGAAKKMSTINRALSSAKKEAMSLTAEWRSLDNTMKNSDYGRNLKAQLDQVLQKAGELQDIKGDVANEIKNIASDTKMWDGAKQGIGVLSSSMQGLASVVGMCGGNVESFTKALNIMKGIEAATNTVIGIGNALQKNSALMVALRAVKTKLFAAAEREATVATQAQTTAQLANNAAAMANPYVALAAAAVAVGTAIWGAVKATDAETESLEKNVDAASANEIWKERLKKAEEEWSSAVTSAAQSQIQKYTELQLKWLECNKDQKLREKFQREYGDEVNKVAGKVKKLSEYENFFVRDTDKVVAAILARAEAEAYADRYAQAILKKAENNRNGSRANGRYYTQYHEGDLLTDEQAAELHRLAGLSYYHNQDLVMTGRLDYGYKLSKSGAEKATEYYRKRAAEIRAQDDAEIEYYQNKAKESSKKVIEAEKAAGMGHEYNPPKSKGGSSNKGGNKKSEGERKAAEQSLAWLREQLQEKQKALENGWIKPEDIEAEKAKIEHLKNDIEKKEIELGFKIVPAEGSLEDLESQLSKQQNDLKNGLIPEDKIEETLNNIDDLQKRIKAKRISLGFEEVPKTDYEKRKDDYLKYIKDTENAAKKFEEAKIKLDQELAEADAKLAQQLRDGLIDQKEYTEKSQKLWDEYADKMGKLPEVIVYNKQNTSMDNIARHIQDQISEIEKELSENDLDVEARLDKEKTKANLQRELENLTHGELSIPAKIKVDYIAKGTDEDLRASYDNASQQIQEIADDYAKGIIKSSGEARKQIAKLNDELIKLGMNPITVEIKTEGQKALENIQGYIGSFNNIVVSTVDSIDRLSKSIADGASAWDVFKNAISVTVQVLSAVQSLMELLNPLIEAHTSKKMAETTAIESSTIASLSDKLAKFGESIVTETDTSATEADTSATEANTSATQRHADANIADAMSEFASAGAKGANAAAETGKQNAKMGPFGWVAGIAAAVAIAGVIFGLISQAKKFAGGGIVQGSTTMGDKVLIRANAGEMVLNNRQQKRLFDLIDQGNVYGNGVSISTVKVKGSDLYIALKNYNKKSNAHGKNIGIS